MLSFVFIDAGRSCCAQRLLLPTEKACIANTVRYNPTLDEAPKHHPRHLINNNERISLVCRYVYNVHTVHYTSIRARLLQSDARYRIWKLSANVATSACCRCCS